MTGYSKTEHRFLRIRLTCFFDDSNFEAFDVPHNLGTRGTSVPQFKPRTSQSSFKNIIDWDSRLVRTPTMPWQRGPNRPGPAGDDLPHWPWTRQILQLGKGNSKGRTSPFDQ